MTFDWRLSTAIALLASAAPASSQSVPSTPPAPIAVQELDGFVTGLALGDRFSGVVLVARDGRVLLERAYGKRDAQAAGQATVATRYNLASAGKMFTAVAVWQQIAAGKLKLDTKVGSVLKDYPNKKFRNVTVRQLLNHSAGAGDIALFGAGSADNRARYRTPAEMIAAFGTRAPAFKPGSRQQYGEYGHVVLGRMVEVVSGEPFDGYLARHLFAPAGMTRTDATPCAMPTPDMAVGYANVAGRRQRNCATQPAAGFPSGWQVTTASDMLRFMIALGQGKLIPAALLAQATAPAAGGLGLGFAATDAERWGQVGVGDGMCADIRTYSARKDVVVVLANRNAPICSVIADYAQARQRVPGRP